MNKVTQLQKVLQKTGFSPLVNDFNIVSSKAICSFCEAPTCSLMLTTTSLIKKKKKSFLPQKKKKNQKHNTSVPEEVKSQGANKKKPLFIIQKIISIFKTTSE